MSYKVDYHMHSYYSDGTMKPTDLLRMYKEKDYDMISLTDHDGVDGIAEAMIAGEALQIKVIPGIEFSTGYDFDGRELELHMLGYYIDIENEALKARLTEIRKDREVRNEKLLAHLNNLGYELTYEDLLQRRGQTYVGKPNFARAIARKGYEIENLWEVLDTVKKDKISTFEAIELIREAGGMSVLAHPMKTKNLAELRSDAFWESLEQILRDLKKHGLKGLECFHPSATEEDSLRLVELAGKYHLHITEGSDFHGE